MLPVVLNGTWRLVCSRECAYGARPTLFSQEYAVPFSSPLPCIATFSLPCPRILLSAHFAVQVAEAPVVSGRPSRAGQAWRGGGTHIALLLAQGVHCSFGTKDRAPKHCEELSSQEGFRCSLIGTIWCVPVRLFKKGPSQVSVRAGACVFLFVLLQRSVWLPAFPSFLLPHHSFGTDILHRHRS